MLHAVGLPGHHWFAKIQCFDTRELYRDVLYDECCFMKDMNCLRLDRFEERSI
ncbi:MAG: hypothetical protein QW589_01045 [Candidatus Bathyarchaeia archaeon]